MYRLSRTKNLYEGYRPAFKFALTNLKKFCLNTINFVDRVKVVFDNKGLTLGKSLQANIKINKINLTFTDAR